MNAEFLAAARDYATRNPADRDHAAHLARIDPAWRGSGRTRMWMRDGADSRRFENVLQAQAAERERDRPPLDLRAARAALQAARTGTPAPKAPAPRTRPEAARTRPLNVGAVRKARETARAALTPPDAPPGALRFAASGGWRWANLHPGLNSHRWERLARALTAAGPLVCLDVRPGACGGDRGRTEILRSPAGELWARITVDPVEAAQDLDAIMRHELAHLGDETVRLRDASTYAAWLREFHTPHRSAAAESFAMEAEDWVHPGTTAAELLARAEEHQAGRRRGR
ncbi:hypothetical protein OG982_06085 [Streptomyces sp. NBC_01551]|uniref:hypothetical protein n=1 Tax=Streptomyces sp. NBC_01551 TaxID=2975876 RepID=UPI00224DA104|nr:hypothetical protein [Streptomyces sp. NBC_01551]MCX4525262.1 hypothetical protein [Streptomyces sp. NBC_01551]